MIRGSKSRASRRGRLGRAVIASAAAFTVALAVAACTPSSSGGRGSADESKTLHVVAGSEVKDLEPLLDDLQKDTGVQLDLTYMGTLEGAEKVAQGGLVGQADATWFPSNKYLALLDGATAQVDRETKIMYSPVVLGVKQTKAQQLGWDQHSPTWQQIVDAVDRGELRYGMTSPVSSNSGFSTLIEAATALSGTGDALTNESIAQAKPGLVTLSKGQSITSGSSGWLADKFTEQPADADAIFNYESVLRGMQVDGAPLSIVVPSDGVITADYPFTLLTGASDEKRDLYDKATTWLQSDEVQRRIAESTHRNTSTNPVNSQQVFELPFPNRLDTVQTLISTYLTDIKKPSQMVFTIDVSGSMAGSRLDELKRALKTMTSEDPNNSFMSFRNRESVQYLTFSSGVDDPVTFEFTDQNRSSELQRAAQTIDALRAQGGTAIYSALEESYRLAMQTQSRNPESFTSVVLFTDGANNGQVTVDQFEQWYQQQRGADSGIQTIPTFVVLFGEADQNEMKQVADLTGGRVFDGGEGLTQAFSEIRGYQ
ncbi:substrate-binding and vWA domain-containing protein [Pseudoclavibacter sp. CFCC 13611]|uniref:substrate-binding and vWA domain-containing protein n=1 Tax=Pseudoclavibacter sp. CFCC 13611 TaxID=2615178 RepID=UPI001301514A|nr:substrate-binding and VWA domain-containing protein [Pseudoclavibacter sp. CFCC 13611]KAB1662644.1 VWA domain-containing protein [Pseudoclavibacter sp. CFCC 13611]